MICPFRVERRISPMIQGEFDDWFSPCVGEGCPCYQKEGDAKWCYRDNRRFPLNKSAREIVEEVTE